MIKIYKRKRNLLSLRSITDTQKLRTAAISAVKSLELLGNLVQILPALPGMGVVQVHNVQPFAALLRQAVV